MGSNTWTYVCIETETGVQFTSTCACEKPGEVITTNESKCNSYNVQDATVYGNGQALLFSNYSSNTILAQDSDDSDAKTKVNETDIITQLQFLFRMLNLPPTAITNALH